MSSLQRSVTLFPGPANQRRAYVSLQKSCVSCSHSIYQDVQDFRRKPLTYKGKTGYAPSTRVPQGAIANVKRHSRGVVRAHQEEKRKMKRGKLALAVLGVAFCSLLGIRGVSLGGQGATDIVDDCPCGHRHDGGYVGIGGYAGVERAVLQTLDRDSRPLRPRDLHRPLSLSGMSDSWGRDFVIAFPENLYDRDALIIVTADVLTTGMVNIPGLNWSQDFIVQPHSAAEILIPMAAEVQGSGIVSNLGIHVTSDHDACVYVVHPGAPYGASCDAYMALPSDILGNEYIILGYPETISGRGRDPTLAPSQFTLVCTADNSQVSITPSANTLDGKPAGVPFNITLNRFDTYQLQAGYQQDLSGSQVMSTKPVAVFAGCKCADIPIGHCCCDFLVEQMTPVATWGRSFLTSVFRRPGSSLGDPLRVLGSEDNTTVSFTPPVPGSPFNLNRAELVEVTIEEPTEIVADKPVLVAQYATGYLWVFAPGDPFEVLILPTEQFLDGYIYLIPAGYELDFTSIFVPTVAISSLLFDGSPINPSIFSPIGLTGYSHGTVGVDDGCHIVTADRPFGIYVYGWDSWSSYGYPGGMRVVTTTSLVTGGGWIPGNSPGPLNKRTFGFNVHSEGGVTWGQLQFNDHGIEMKVHSDTIHTLTVYGDTTADFSGDCRVDGIGEYTFDCEVEDRGEPGRAKDKFSLDVWDSDSNLYYAAGGGNIQIHTAGDGVLANLTRTFGGRSGPESENNGSIQHADVVRENRDALWQNSPNPFHKKTGISYDLSLQSHVKLEVFDHAGRLVKTLVDRTQESGTYCVDWHANGHPSGIYFYRLRAGDFTDMKKMVLLR